ncbi:LuxR C-terminal-related transcriptional regulator [Streptomyces sp. yara]|uniref:LuxR C-terminal-related transcriptional regulator n=1 Tax=Streptomyces sp. yara TaxID=3458421 RepID=UPI00403FD734
MDKGRFAVPAGITAWATALGVAALMLGTGLSAPHPSGGRELLGSVLLVIGGLALAAHRRAPLMVLAVTGVCAVGSLAAGFDALAVSYLVAVYGAVRAGHRTIALGVSVGLVAVLHLTALVFLPDLADVHVVMLTNYGMDEYVFDALRAGAAGFLVKDILPEDFLHSVRVAARGDALLAPAVTRTLIDRYVSQPPPAFTSGGPERLTDRERETVALAAGGLSNDEIARRLVISPATAKTHINRAMAKLHARDRAQLVVFAYESGLVTPRGA